MLSSINEIHIPKSLKNVSVLGHRAEEIATNLKLENFVEKDDTDIVDLLNASHKVSNPEKCLPKPLYISIGNTNFKKYDRPKIFE